MLDIYADTSNLDEIKALNPRVKGFTTNPTLMRQAGVTDYESFCKQVLTITDKPVSFEVFADEAKEMERQAEIIASWADNVYVKIPIVNTSGFSSRPLINKLAKQGIKINVTAITKTEQLEGIDNALQPMILSFFAGRVADTGRSPLGMIKQIKNSLATGRRVLWASTREVFNVYQAEQAGADIITLSPDLFKKYEKFKGMTLDQLTLETVRQFYDDAQASNFAL